MPMPWHSLVVADWPSHGPSSSIGLVLTPPMAMPWDCLVPSDWQSHGPGSSMGLALPLPHTWPCHGFAWCYLSGNPNWPSSSIGAFLGQAHGHAMALPRALLIGHHMGQAIPWALSLATTHGHAMALIWTF